MSRLAAWRATGAGAPGGRASGSDPRPRGRADGLTFAPWRAVSGNRSRRRRGAATIGSVLAVVDEVFCAAEASTDFEEARRAVRETLRRRRIRQPAAVALAAARAATMLPRRCLALSASEIVQRALLLARATVRHVVVAESRPGCEGVITARRLATAGVPVTLVVDALAPALVAEVDAVVVGADAVTPDTLWHKCGTLALALAARESGRPLWVVSTEDRLLGPGLAARLDCRTPSRGGWRPDREPALSTVRRYGS